MDKIELAFLILGINLIVLAWIAINRESALIDWFWLGLGNIMVALVINKLFIKLKTKR